MNIFHQSFSPPLSFETSRFIIFPTDPELFRSDYSAVMNNKNMLRIWSQSEWPEDSFSPEENREDLKLHRQDNESHSAYGYMIYTPDRNVCLGSVYVNSLVRIAENYDVSEAGLRTLEHFDARIDYWFTEGQPQAEEDLTLELAGWFRREWKISPLFSARPGMDVRQEIYQKLNFKKELGITGKNMELILYSNNHYDH